MPQEMLGKPQWPNKQTNDKRQQSSRFVWAPTHNVSFHMLHFQANTYVECLLSYAAQDTHCCHNTRMLQVWKMLLANLMNCLFDDCEFAKRIEKKN